MSSAHEATPVRIAEIGEHVDRRVLLRGWLYSRRSSGKLHFLQLRDGTGIVQCVVARADVADDLFETAGEIGQESSIELAGTVRSDSRSAIGFELGVDDLRVIQCVSDYPISPKSHGVDFLLQRRHLWPPVLTPAACEGTTTLFETDYFDERAYLTQSGQLYAEAGCQAFGRVYTFGPTFRAEKSKTRRHLTEFWMIEPEAAFLDIDGAIALAEGLICAMVERTLERCAPELGVLERDTGPLAAVHPPFPRLTYAEAVERLARKGQPIEHGEDFGGDEETLLASEFERPLVVHRYPAAIKPFYMKRDPEDPALALNMDILAPEGYGEIVGGSVREEDLATLDAQLAEKRLDAAPLEWYRDLRRYGTVPHAGFGLGLERTLSWICGIPHLRETIPFPRLLGRLAP
jgi:asparaginyl-tRNA synthetase